MSLVHISWIDILETGVAEIDSEHRELIDDFNTMVDLLPSLTSRHQLVSRFEQMLAKLKQHFETEEDILRQRGFPRLEAHIEEHKRFRAQLERGLEMTRHSGSGFGPATFLEYLHVMLIEVLVRHDLDYKSHILHTTGSSDIVR
ncbi:MAG TPA: hemerythrin family protein [Terriglobales bacterium]|nr:hemerythrin family protein [Terriglobales bacterium]